MKRKPRPETVPEASPPAQMPEIPKPKAFYRGVLTPDDEAVILEALEAAPDGSKAVELAAQALGISPSKVAMHRVDHPEFSEKWDVIMALRRQVRTALLKDKHAEQNTEFLEVLAATGRVEAALAAVDVSRSVMLARREKDPEFAKAWEFAMQMATDMLEDEAIRRGRDGWDEPVFYKGTLQGTVRKYSDSLLLASLKALRREKWNESVNMRLGGGMTLEVLVDEAQKLRKRVPTIDQQGNSATDDAADGAGESPAAMRAALTAGN